MPREEIAAAIRYAFQIAKPGRPGPVLVDITKDAQQGMAVFDFAAAHQGVVAADAGEITGYSQTHCPAAYTGSGGAAMMRAVMVGMMISSRIRSG